MYELQNEARALIGECQSVLLQEHPDLLSSLVGGLDALCLELNELPSIPDDAIPEFAAPLIERANVLREEIRVTFEAERLHESRQSDAKDPPPFPQDAHALLESFDALIRLFRKLTE